MTQEKTPLTPSRQTPPPANQITLTSYGSLEQMFKVAQYLSDSPLVPDTFKAPGSVLIALNLASRLSLDPFMVMQQIYIVHGRPGMSGQFAIALLSRSPKYRRIEYQYLNGTDCTAGMRVIGHRVDDPEDSHPDVGTAITPEMCRSEGWDKNPKWRSMPEQMYRYRAASFFARAFCPEELMGLQTAEELEDAERSMRTARTREITHEAPAPAASPFEGTVLIPAEPQKPAAEPTKTRRRKAEPAPAEPQDEAPAEPATKPAAEGAFGRFMDMFSQGITWQHISSALAQDGVQLPRIGASVSEMDEWAAAFSGSHACEQLAQDGFISNSVF
ncbi:MAG: hypothetical protein LUE08_07305 [Akkermansiaceae bacterium]|nr:hypothetical protein [Akkermansiaceae bacterium]